jgi:hypothetical protein
MCGCAGRALRRLGVNDDRALLKTADAILAMGRDHDRDGG